MPYINKEQLDEQFKTNSFSNLYLIFGEESYLKEYYVLKLRKKLVDSAFADFNFHRHDKKSTLDDIFMDASVMPMMGEYSFVLVYDYPIKLKENTEALKEYLKDIPESAVIVFWCDTYELDEKKDSSVIKLFSKYGSAVNIKSRSVSDLTKLIISEAKKNSCVISRENAAYFVNLVGFDIYTLKNEIKKVCSYISEGEITKKDIDSLAVKSLQTKVFDLSKFIISKQSDKAFALLNDLYSQQEEPVKILAILSSTFIDTYRVKLARQANVPDSQIIETFKYNPNREFVITGNAARYNTMYSVDGLRKAMDLLSDADTKMKTTSLNDNLVLEETVAKLLLMRNK